MRGPPSIAENPRYLAVRAALLVAAAVCQAVPASAQGAADPVGVVDRVSGRWVSVQDRQPLSRGDLIYGDQTVMNGIPSAGSVRILLFSGQRWEKTCTDREPCLGTFRPAVSNERSARGFWAFLSSFWKSGEQLPPVLAGSRSTGERGARNALILSEGDVADFSSAVDVRAGHYTLRLAPAPGGSLNRTPGVIQRSIEVGQSGISLSGVPQGLYVASLSDADGQAIGSTALVLVVPTTADAARELWAQAQQAIEGWAGAAPQTRSALLAHTLYAIDARER